MISSLLSDVFGDWWSEEVTEESQLSLRRLFTLILGFFIVLPLGLLRDLSQIGETPLADSLLTRAFSLLRVLFILLLLWVHLCGHVPVDLSRFAHLRLGH